MLISAKDTRGYVLDAIDGELGRCRDFLFDDQHWKIRYMVANTRSWLPGRKVLISPQQLDNPNWEGEKIPVALTKDEVKGAPHIDESAPVSRINERAWADYFGYARYWAGPASWGPIGGAVPASLGMPPGTPETRDAPPYEQHFDDDDVRVRSCHELIGYQVDASNGEFGTIEDVLIDTVGWAVHKWVLSSNHLPSDARVLCSPERTVDVSWGRRTVKVDRTREKLAKGWREPVPSIPDTP